MKWKVAKRKVKERPGKAKRCNKNRQVRSRVKIETKRAKNWKLKRKTKRNGQKRKQSDKNKWTSGDSSKNRKQKKKTPQTPKMSNKSNCEEKWDRNRTKRKKEKWKATKRREEEEVLIKRRVEEGKSTINNWGPFYRLLRVYLFFFFAVIRSSVFTFLRFFFTLPSID